MLSQYYIHIHTHTHTVVYILSPLFSQVGHDQALSPVLCSYRSHLNLLGLRLSIICGSRAHRHLSVFATQLKGLAQWSDTAQLLQLPARGREVYLNPVLPSVC